MRTLNLSFENSINALKAAHYHKLIIGAALKDFKSIEDYAYLFTHAGANVIDISAFPHSVISAKKGIDRAIQENPDLVEPIIMVSINIGQDPHFRRIEVDWQSCTECQLCIASCPSEAFSSSEEVSFSYNADLCFGCSNCLDYCHFNALSFKNWSSFEANSLLELIDLGAGAFEIHLNNDLNAFSEFYNSLPRLPEDFLQSFSIGSELMSLAELENSALNIIRNVRDRYHPNKELIIQTDGIPLSGARTVFKDSSRELEKDMQSIINAKTVINKIKELDNPENIFVQLAGGITEKSFKKAIENHVPINGVAIGSYARNKLKNLDKEQAIKEAKKLISYRSKN